MPAMADFRLSELERRFLKLALCSSAQGAEISTSAVKLIESWRHRGVESSTIESALEGNGAEAPAQISSKPDYGLTIVPWGRHKGKMFMDVPPHDLRSTWQWITEDPGRAARFKNLAHSINQFLNQGS
jgi:hypothetical protein